MIFLCVKRFFRSKVEKSNPIDSYLFVFLVAVVIVIRISSDSVLSLSLFNNGSSILQVD